MRIGVNPQKSSFNKLKHKKHRIILPFWIPNTNDDYFKHQPDVLRWCLKSLTETINPELTNITLINNASCEEASQVAEGFVESGLIDKYVIRLENRGKLEPILSEARASFEDYITISDADFLFFPGWEDSVIDVFSNFKNAGVVTCYPCPNLAFNYNSAWIIDSKVKCGSIVSKIDFDMVEKGLGNNPEMGIYSGLGVKGRYSWRNKQYFLEKENVRACLGATHALGTIKRDILQKLPFKKVEYVFKNGYEKDYIDFMCEKLGYYRLSTPNCNAYHMGNTIPIDLISDTVFNTRSLKIFPDHDNRNVILNKVKWLFLRIISRFFRKLKIL